jgi:hypothetical protein
MVIGASLIAPAQTPLQWEQGSVPLDNGWRTQAGDQAGWAAPDLDDSKWQLTALDESRAPTPGKYDERWYRLRIDLPAQHPPLSLLITAPGGTYEVFLNGRLLPGAVLLPQWRAIWFPTAQVVPVDGSGPAVLAVRTRVPNASFFFADHNVIRVSLGTSAAISDAARTEQSDRFNHVVIGFGINILIALAAFPLILLSRFQRNHCEYLWIGVNLLALACLNIGEALVGRCFVPGSFFFFLVLPALYFAPIAQIEFTFSFAGRTVTRPWRVYQAALLLAILVFPALVWIGVLGFFPYQAVEATLLLPASIAMPVLLLVWYRRGNREAGWLILPSLLPLLSVCLVDLGIIGNWVGSPSLATIIRGVPIGPFTLWISDPADLLYLVAIGIVIFLRFNRVSHQQARSAAELEAAQRVQSLLMRQVHADGALFRTEAIYRPANEVGGDFFHTVEIEGLARIVVGDVSGKGLGAAMLVATLIGSLDSNRSTDPVTVLNQLNHLLLARQQGGFVTCLCASIDQNALVRICNAGHLAPYRNGEEIPLDCSLPLGLAEAEYNETAVQLGPGDRLTFLSDGVVEARNATGELFGFARAQAISTQSAESIARTAQGFGQEDDITVLTLTFAPVAVAHA